MKWYSYSYSLKTIRVRVPPSAEYEYENLGFDWPFRTAKTNMRNCKSRRGDAVQQPQVAPYGSEFLSFFSCAAWLGDQVAQDECHQNAEE